MKMLLVIYEELKMLLVGKLHGVQRVPALLFTNPLASLASINCNKYEILLLPMHVSPEEATMINEKLKFVLVQKKQMF